MIGVVEGSIEIAVFVIVTATLSVCSLVRYTIFSLNESEASQAGLSENDRCGGSKY